MEWVVAFGHLLGALIATMALGVVIVMIAAWEGRRNQKRAIDEAALALGVPPDAVDTPELITRLTQWSAERFSSEHFNNRLSDFCGYVRAAWEWLGTIVQVALLIGVTWYTFTEDLGNAVIAWGMVLVALFFWVTAVAFALMCRLLTGRYPGQARAARKGLAEFIRRSAETNTQAP